jgi:hypothetical protein
MAMVLLAIGGAFAEPFVFEDYGVIIEIPNGMTATDISDENGSSLEIKADDNAALLYGYYFAYSEQLEGKYLDDLTEEEVAELVESIVVGMGSEAISALVERDDYLVLFVEDTASTQAHLLTLLEGWVFDVAVGKLDGTELIEEEIETAYQLLVTTQFEEEAEAE